LGFFKNGHPKNVQNPILESLSHAEIHEFLISSPPKKRENNNIHTFMHEYFHHSFIRFITHFLFSLFNEKGRVQKKGFPLVNFTKIYSSLV
jgi:hypothetical protein